MRSGTAGPPQVAREVDKTGPCLVVAKTRGGALVGGYAPKGFAGFGEYRGSIAAFLFSWPDGNTNAPAIKLQKVGGAGGDDRRARDGPRGLVRTAL